MKEKNYYSEPIYIFWTGGYDSTFRLCQLLIKYRKKVQPIYISDKYIDNYKSNNTRRKNHIHEFNSQEKIIENLHKSFPFTKDLLYETLVINNVKYDNEILKSMKEFKKKKYVRRARCQYGAMAQITKNLNEYIELCAETGGFLHKKLNKKMKCNTKNCNYRDYVFDTQSHNEMKIFDKFVLPIIDYTKKDMFDEAKKYKYEHILYKTWSCWYPRNGKPCGRCTMCKHRYVPYKEHFQNNNITSDIGDNTIHNFIYVILLILFIILFLFLK